ncbi:MAG: TerC family protein [candidate division FCPU426 bacterium]
MGQTLAWMVFGAVIVIMMALDLGVFNRRAHEVSFREALTWSAIWISLALLFNLGVWWWRGQESALLFLTGYLVEESLSVDNLFVFIIIFSYFRVPSQYQHKVLFWGILGAVVMRGLFIATGVTLIHRFHWLIYLFGLFLIYTGLRLAWQKEKKELEPDKNIFVRILRRFFPVTSQFEGSRFFVRQGGRWLVTPLLVTVLVVESTDVIFALDSIPAILAITTDPFLVYTSNIFAILGLRSLYFALSGFMRMFHYLNYGLAVILAFIGVKMTLSDLYHMPIQLALGFIAVVLAVSILASVIWKPKAGAEPQG